MDYSPASSSSSSSSSSGSSIHKASLVDASLHSPALIELLDIKLSRPVIEYVVECVADTVDYAMGRPSTSSRGRAINRPENSKFVTFVNNVITRAEITTPVMLAALVYIDRAKPHLHIALEEWALERVFLGAVIVASKYLNDSTLKNVHWALCTGVFGKRDVGRIEREFLDVLDFQLSIAEADILSHHDGVSAVALDSHTHRLSSSSSSHNSSSLSPRKHRRSREHVPELYSSGESSGYSSSSGDSPRTPSTLASPASPAVKSKPMDVEIQGGRSKKFHLNDIIRSIPIEIPNTSTRSHSRYTQDRATSHHRSIPMVPITA